MARRKTQPETPPVPAGKVTADLVIAKYVETRDLIEARKKAFEAEIADLKALQEKREQWLMTQLQQTGADGIKTAHGTAFIATKDSATVADWDAFYEWVLVNDRPDFLERRVNKTAVKTFLDDGQTPPPGVNYTTFQQVQVRRK